jgi:hypothetical protein
MHCLRCWMTIYFVLENIMMMMSLSNIFKIAVNKTTLFQVGFDDMTFNSQAQHALTHGVHCIFLFPQRLALPKYNISNIILVGLGVHAVKMYAPWIPSSTPCFPLGFLQCSRLSSVTSRHWTVKWSFAYWPFSEACLTSKTCHSLSLYWPVHSVQYFTPVLLLYSKLGL